MVLETESQVLPLAIVYSLRLTSRGNLVQALLNTSKHGIAETTEIQLSRDEDSVTSMAVANASEDSVVTLAGINSSMAEQKRDNNQHLRSFKLDLPGKGRGNVETATATAESNMLSRASLFRTKGAKAGSDTYQRVVRLSPWRGDGAKTPRVAAITTGLAPSGEIVFLQATAKPTESDVIGRIQLGDKEEAEDVDIIDLAGGKKDGKFRVAYTNGIDVFTCQISSATRANASPEVSCVYTTPLPDGGRSRPKFRTLRFLSPTSLLLLQNAPGRNGSELVVLDLPSPDEKEKKPATILRRKKLRRTIKIGLGLDVCNLGFSPETQQQQTIIAVTGSDQSIEVLTLEYDPRKGYGKIQPYTSLHDVHPFSMTKICFSTFTPPAHPITPEIGPQYVKLASVSMGNTVVVHTLPLSPFPATSRTPRYVLAIPEPWTNLLSFTAVLAILVVAILLQGVMEIRGGSPSYLGVSEWLPPHLRDIVAGPAVTLPPPVKSVDDPLASITSASSPPSSFSSPSSATPTTTISVMPNTPRQSLRDLLHARQDIEPNTDIVPSTPSNIIVVRCTTSDDGSTDEVVIETLPADSKEEEEEEEPEQHQQQEKSRSNMRRWEQLGEEQKTIWKQRLINAGHWTVEEGEAILTGVLFSEYCGLIGGLVRDGLP